jgi:hypothetical protein
MSKLRTGEIVTGASAALLLVVMFLDWYGVRGIAAANAWQAFGVIDILLALVIALGLGTLAFQVVGRGPATPVAFEVLTSTVALIALLLVAYRILNQPGPNDLVDVKLGAWLGLLATAGVFWGAWKAMSDERPRPADPPAPEPERRPIPA